MTALNRSFSLHGKRRHHPNRNRSRRHQFQSTPSNGRFGRARNYVYWTFVSETAPRCAGCGYIERWPGASAVRQHCRVNRDTGEISSQICDGTEETFYHGHYRY